MFVGKVTHFRAKQQGAFFWTDNSSFFHLKVTNNIVLSQFPKALSIVQRSHNEHPPETMCLHSRWCFFWEHEVPQCSTQRLCKFWPYYFPTGSHFLVWVASDSAVVLWQSDISRRPSVISSLLNKLSAGQFMNCLFNIFSTFSFISSFHFFSKFFTSQ